MNVEFLPAEFFYQNITKLSRSYFYYLVREKEINFIQLYRGTKLYDVGDWNKKNPDRQLNLAFDEKTLIDK